MVNFIVTANDLDGISQTLNNGNFVFVNEGVLVSNTAEAIDLTLNSQLVAVHGNVVSSAAAGIRLGNAAGGTGGHHVTVGDSGSVMGLFEGVRVFDGNSRVENNGEIYGFGGGGTGVAMAGIGDSIVNHGLISGVSSGISFVNNNTATTNTILNDGHIHGGRSIQGSLGAEIVTNRGLITGDMNLFGGDDVVDNAAGEIIGLMDFGAGNDELIGGAGVERARGGSGADSFDFGGGNDRFLAGNNEEALSDNNDDLDGGDGNDTYDASQIFSAVDINLNELRASGSEIGLDAVLNFENVFGGNAADTLSGDAGNNVIRGRNGADVINGLSGNDKLFGDAGTDRITGSTGRDVMTGGADADTFVFNAEAETGKSPSTRDVITDFVSGTDKIDLSLIDANGAGAGNGAFTFIGAGAFTNVAGQLRFTQNASAQTTVVEGDSTGDGAADFQIQLTGLITPVAGDFIL